ncbi:MAG: MFS transporter [Bacillus sp. (in: firmicutes)]
MNEAMKMQKATYHLWTFLISKMISSLGSNVYSFGLSLYILAMTGSALSFAANMICSILPRTILAPVAGYLSDRFSKKVLVLTGQAGAIVSVGGLLLYSSMFDLSLLAVYITTACYSISSTFTSVAFSSSIANLVDESRIQKAMSFNQLSYSIAAIGGPVIGGMMYGFVSMQIFLLIHMTAYAISLLLEATMNFRLFSVNASKVDVQKEGIVTSMRKGLLYVKGKRIVSMILWVSLWLNFFFTAFNVGGVYILVEILKVEAKHIGVIEAAGAVGMLIASIYMSSRSTVKNPLMFSKRAILTMSVIIGILAVPLMINLPYIGIVIFYMITMFGLTSCGVLTNTPIGVLLQTEVDEAYRGRVFGILETMAMGMMPLGTMLFGLLYDLVPAHLLLLGSSAVLIIITLYMFRPSMMRMAQVDYAAEKAEIV